MEVIKINDYNQSKITNNRLVCALGFFDTIHLGHQKVLRQTVNEAKKLNLKAAVVTVSKTVNKTGFNVLETKDRYDKLEALELDYIYELQMNENIRNSSAQDFIDFLKDIKCDEIVCGLDYRFGQNGSGDVKLLEENFNTSVIEFEQNNGQKISTTLIKECLNKGKIKHATSLLGYNYFIKGEVMHGRELGRTIGVPTANLIVETPSIGKGVYITRTKVDNKWYRSMTNIGVNPTMKSDGLTIETYIGDEFNDSIYGQIIEVQFWDKIRDEVKFNSVDELIARLNLDKQIMEEYIYENSTIS